MTASKIVMSAASGVGGAGENIEDLFSTDLYIGNGSSGQSITNGIDLDGEGGMVWIKARDETYTHLLFDTERGATKYLSCDDTGVETTASTSLTSFNTNGFSLGGFSNANDTNYKYASWTWRKAPKFFDVVSWTGDGTGTRDIPHDLDTTVGMIVMKHTGSTLYDWFIYNRGDTSNTGRLNLTDPFNGSSLILRPTPGQETTHFQVSGTYNGSGDKHIAYLFAHNDDDGGFGPNGNQDIIKCGSYTGNGSNSGQEIDLGFEAGWVFIQCSSHTSNNAIVDKERGMHYNHDDAREAQSHRVIPSANNAEGLFIAVAPTPTGFYVAGGDSDCNYNGRTYVYMAIRRGPMGEPESASEVFSVVNDTGDLHTEKSTIGFSPDMLINSAVGGSYGGDSTGYVGRLGALMNGLASRSAHSGPRTSRGLRTFDGGDDRIIDNINWDGYELDVGGGWGTTEWAQYFWKRAPKFFDVVAYAGNSTAGHSITHNLEAVPEMMWIKETSGNGSWVVYHTGMDATAPEDYFINLDTGLTRVNSIGAWQDTAPTATQFTLGTLGDANDSGSRYIAFLWASLDGISKIGSYTGTGSDINIDCGFTSGARFVLIKRTDANGSWWVHDTERGITTGNDSMFNFDTYNAEVTNTDQLSPLSSGFTVASTATSDFNASGGNYIYYAIA